MYGTDEWKNRQGDSYNPPFCRSYPCNKNIILPLNLKRKASESFTDKNNAQKAL